MDLQFVDDQLGLYGDHSHKVEAWPAGHWEAVECRALEDAAALGLAILANIQRHCDGWTVEIEQGKAAFSWEQADRLAGWYRNWLERTGLLLRSMEEHQQRGAVLEGAEQLRQRYREISLLSLDTEKFRRSLQSLDRGQGTPMAEALDGLRDHLRRRRTG